MALLVRTGGSAPAALPDPVRWVLWLVAGVVVGVLAGFAVGLARPRAWAYGPYDPAERH